MVGRGTSAPTGVSVRGGRRRGRERLKLLKFPPNFRNVPVDLGERLLRSAPAALVPLSLALVTAGINMESAFELCHWRRSRMLKFLSRGCKENKTGIEMIQSTGSQSTAQKFPRIL